LTLSLRQPSADTARPVTAGDARMLDAVVVDRSV
jgi:hypothetical protein